MYIRLTMNSKQTERKIIAMNTFSITINRQWYTIATSQSINVVRSIFRNEGLPCLVDESGLAFGTAGITFHTIDGVIDAEIERALAV